MDWRQFVYFSSSQSEIPEMVTHKCSHAMDNEGKGECPGILWKPVSFCLQVTKPLFFSKTQESLLTSDS